METIIGITIFALAVIMLVYNLYTHERENEERLRSMAHTRDKLNK